MGAGLSQSRFNHVARATPRATESQIRKLRNSTIERLCSTNEYSKFNRTRQTDHEASKKNSKDGGEVR